MRIAKIPLSKNERKYIRFANRFQMGIGVLVGLPIVIILIYYIVICIINCVDNKFDYTDLIVIFFLVIVIYLGIKYAGPFYIKSFKDLRATEKYVIETKIISSKEEFVSDLGLTYMVYTELPSSLSRFGLWKERKIYIILFL